MARVIVSNEGQRVVVAADERTVVTKQTPQVAAVAVAAGPQGPRGQPGASGAGYTHQQPTPSTVWAIAHNLGFRPSVELLSAGGAEIEGDVLHIDANLCTATFLIPVAGLARLT